MEYEAADKGKIAILTLTNEKAKGDDPNKPVSLTHIH